ncbi:MAG: PLP-dependent transferase [Bryobacteraceae bacterium]|nr:PLP-dependent transferase [Bryobacteraceae bacterium]
MANRRSFLQSMASLPVIGGLVPAALAGASPKGRDYFQELGVRTFVNAAGTYTTLTASLMQPEVVAAIQYASKQFVSIVELQDKVGERIAAMLGAESAMVTSGAAGALTCGTAACLTGTNQKAILQIPDLTGLKSEVIVQKLHRYGYDHAVRAAGVRMVEVETAEQMERAVNPNTAMMLFFNDADPRGQVKAADFVAFGKKHNIPTFNDASADVPPVENLTKYIKMGFDLVTFSGGKGLRGPQSAGVLAGRKDLIQAARLNTSPYSDSIARGMKVNKEEMLGMLVALEVFTKKDHDAERSEWDRRVRTIVDSVKDLPSLKTEIRVPEIANHTPHLHLEWDQSALKISPDDVRKQLREGQPSIETTPADKDHLVMTVWMLQPGEAQIVARRLRSILKAV